MVTVMMVRMVRMMVRIMMMVMMVRMAIWWLGLVTICGTAYLGNPFSLGVETLMGESVTMSQNKNYKKYKLILHGPKNYRMIF